MSAGKLFFKVGFQEPTSASDGAGGVVGGFAERFAVSAGYRHLRGTETVMAARLSGRHTQVILVRSSGQTKQVTTDWRIVDKRNGDVFNIRDITPSDDRGWFDILAEKGVAT
jgi:head-tail adaptor